MIMEPRILLLSLRIWTLLSILDMNICIVSEKVNEVECHVESGFENCSP